MSALRILGTITLVLAFAGAAPAQDLVPVPPLAARVTDQAGMLDASQRSSLEQVLAEYEAKTGSQIAVLTVKTTAPEQIEQYSIRVADAWKLGRKGVDDGVLLLVAPGNTSAMRRLRIEAGRGVQGVLTDAKSKQVLEDVIAPYFRKQQYYEGLVAGVGAIATLLNAEKFPAAPQRQVQQQSAGGGLPIPLLFFGALVLMWLFRPRRRAGLASNGWGSGATGFILGAALDSLSRGSGRSGGGGGFSGGGGGFSGGGGSFDGGGASGDW